MFQCCYGSILPVTSNTINCSPLNDFSFLDIVMATSTKTRTNTKCGKLLESAMSHTDLHKLTLRMGTPATFLPFNFILCFNFE